MLVSLIIRLTQMLHAYKKHAFHIKSILETMRKSLDLETVIKTLSRYNSM